MVKTLVTLILMISPAALVGAEPGSEIRLEHCNIQFSEMVDVPALHSGPLAQLNVKLHDAVAAEESIARLDDTTLLIQKRSAMLQRDSAAVQKQDDVDMAFAKAALEEATEDLATKQRMERESPHSVMKVELSRSRLAYERAKLEVDRTLRQRKIADIEYEQALADLALIDDSVRRLDVVAPLAGIVTEVYRRRGEWVAMGEPVVRLARIDRLLVKALVETERLPPSAAPGCPVSLTVTLPGGEQIAVRGKVQSAAPEVTTLGTYQLHAEVENPLRDGNRLLRPGMRGTLTVYLQQSVAKNRIRQERR